MGGVVALPLEGALLDGIVSYAEIGADDAVVRLGDLVLFKVIILRLLPFSVDMVTDPAACAQVQTGKQRLEYFDAVVIVVLIDPGKALRLLIGPDAAAAVVKEKQGLIQAGRHLCQHVIQKAHGTIVQGEVKNQQAEDAVADHGAVDRRAGKDIEGLPKPGKNHGCQDDGIALGIDTRRIDRFVQENCENRKENAVIHHTVDHLSRKGHKAEIGRAVGHDFLQREGVTKEGIAQQLHPVQNQDQVHQTQPQGPDSPYTAVFQGKGEQGVHHIVHTQKIDIAADGRKKSAVRDNDQQIPEYRRGQRCEQQSQFMRDFPTGTVRNVGADAQGNGYNGDDECDCGSHTHYPLMWFFTYDC